MGDRRNRCGSGRVVRAFGGACVAWALVLATACFAQAPAAPKREAIAKPATGTAVISYEESKGSAIIYLEEGGALVNQGAQGIVQRREPPAAPAKAASAPAPQPATPAAPGGGRNARIVTRQPADAEIVAGRR